MIQLPSGLTGDYGLFMEEWKICSEGVLLPSEDNYNPLVVWSGEFFDNETVVLATEATGGISRMKCDYYVGISDEEGFIAVNKSPEYHAINATHLALGGLKNALLLLNTLRGLPDGRRLNMKPNDTFISNGYRFSASSK